MEGVSEQDGEMREVIGNPCLIKYGEMREVIGNPCLNKYGVLDRGK